MPPPPRTQPLIAGDFGHLVTPYPFFGASGDMPGIEAAVEKYRHAIITLREALESPNRAQDALLIATLPAAVLIADLDEDSGKWLHPDHGDVPAIVAAFSVFAHWFMADAAHRWTSSALPLPNPQGETMLRISGSVAKRMGDFKPLADINELSLALCGEGVKPHVVIQALLMALGSIAAETAWGNPAILNKNPSYPYHLAGSMALHMHTFLGACRQIDHTPAHTATM